MRMLVVGAGAIGGYFGGRLLEKGEDVTFLVREKRKQQLEKDGLVIKSAHGDLQVAVKTIMAGEKAEPFDVILLATKAYHLHNAMESIQDFVSEETIILPLFNGIAHLEKLDKVFEKRKVMGGLCFIETTLDEKGTILQTSPIHDLLFGERNGEQTDRILRLKSAFTGTKASFTLSENIEQDMWHKYLFITTFSGVTSLFRSPIGPIREQEYGRNVMKKVLAEVAAIMRNVKAPIAEDIEEVQYTRLNSIGYNMKSSLQRDMEKGFPIESEHFFGYLLKVAEDFYLDTTAIQTIYANLKIYEESELKPKS